MKLPSMLLLACLGAAPLSAQQADAVAAPAGEDGQKPRANAGPQKAPKPVAYIGVLTREVPAELRAQISVPEGFGLLVVEVMPDSPAETAGIKVHDVLVKFDDQQLVNMEQLMALVRARKKGDVVNLAVISAGRERQVPVTLGEHLPPADGQPPHNGGFDRNGWPQFNGMPPMMGEAGRVQRGGFQHQNHPLFELIERFQQEMREYEERLREWSKNGATGPLPEAPRFNTPGSHQRRGGPQEDTGISLPPGTTQQQFHFSESHSSANASRRDESGEYSIRNEDGKKIFTARPVNGAEQSWPIDTESQRQAVPPEFREKLKLMEGAGRGRLQFHPSPPEYRNAPTPPAPSGKASA